MASLTSKAMKAGVWSAIERVGQQMVLVIVQLWLARLLGPEAFGLVAMLIIFYNIAQVLVDSGFGNALIQKSEIDETDCNSVFYFNIVLGALAAGAMCAISPWVAGFFERPVLQPMTCWLALIPLINSFGVVQQSLLRRQLRFRRILAASMPATVISGVIGVAMALNGFGVWALVAQMVSLRFFWVLLMWRVSPWRPAWEYSGRSIRRMFDFGSKLMADSLLTVIFENLYFMVIGKLFDAVTLGLYFNARRLQRLVSSTLAGVLVRVVLPVFSQVQDDTERMRRGLRRATRLVALVIGMVCAMMITMADPVFRGILGDDWIGSIPYFQWLAIVALFYPFSAMNLNVLMAIGRSDQFLIAGVIKKVLIVLNLVICWRYGVMALVYGLAVLSLLDFFVNAFFTGQHLRYPAYKQLWDAAPYFAVAAAAGLVMVVFAQLCFGLPHLVIAAGQAILGTGIWLAASYAFELEAYNEFVKLFRFKANQREKSPI